MIRLLITLIFAAFHFSLLVIISSRCLIFLIFRRRLPLLLHCMRALAKICCIAVCLPAIADACLHDDACLMPEAPEWLLPPCREVATRCFMMRYARWQQDGRHSSCRCCLPAPLPCRRYADLARYYFLRCQIIFALLQSGARCRRCCRYVTPLSMMMR